MSAAGKLARALLNLECTASLRGLTLPMKPPRKILTKRIVRRRLKSTGERRLLAVAVRVWEKRERMRP